MKKIDTSAGVTLALTAANVDMSKWGYASVQELFDLLNTTAATLFLTEDNKLELNVVIVTCTIRTTGHVLLETSRRSISKDWVERKNRSMYVALLNKVDPNDMLTRTAHSLLEQEVSELVTRYSQNIGVDFDERSQEKYPGIGGITTSFNYDVRLDQEITPVDLSVKHTKLLGDVLYVYEWVKQEN